VVDEDLAQAGPGPEVVHDERRRDLGPLRDELERGIAHPRPPGAIVD